MLFYCECADVLTTSEELDISVELYISISIPVFLYNLFG